MKNNLSALISSQESSFYYSFENYSSRKNSKRLTNLLRSDFLRATKRKGTLYKPEKKTITKFKLLNNSKLLSKNNTFLSDLTKISPLRSLKYQLKLYDQKNKFGSENYVNNKTYTPEKNKNISFFKKKPYFINNDDILNKNIHKKLYSVLQIDKCSNNKNNNKINNNNSCLLFNDKINTNCSNTFITNNSMIKTNNSNAPYTSRVSSNSQKNIFAETLNRKIEETIKEITNANTDLKNDIFYSNKYNNLNNFNKLNPYFSNKKKIKKNKSCIDIKKINKELRLDEDSETYEKKNLERRIKYLDKNCQQILKQSILIVENEDRLMGKNFYGKFYDLNNKNKFQKLNNEIKEAGKKILLLKKQYKGDKAILPDNETEYLHKLIKENMYNNKKDQNYLDEIMSQASIINRFYKSTDYKIKKRLVFLHKQNKTKRNKFLYNNQ